MKPMEFLGLAILAAVFDIAATVFFLLWAYSSFRLYWNDQATEGKPS